jgi:acetyltransferase-like isoleucine patch superfamily enzyme
MLNPDVWLTLENATRVHPSAVIAPWVSLGADCIVHPYAVIGRLPDSSPALARQPQRIRQLSIGRGTVIGCHAVLYSDVNLGSDCLVGDYASVREGCRIGDRCVIGRQVTIHYDARVADDCRFMDGTHLTGAAQVGRGCFFGVGVITSNDRRVDLVDYHFPGAQPPIFGEGVMVGSGANILAGVTIGDRALIGAGAVVTRDVVAGDVMLGSRAASSAERDLVARAAQ